MEARRQQRTDIPAGRDDDYGGDVMRKPLIVAAGLGLTLAAILAIRHNSQTFWRTSCASEDVSCMDAFRQDQSGIHPDGLDQMDTIFATTAEGHIVSFSSNDDTLLFESAMEAAGSGGQITFRQGQTFVLRTDTIAAFPQLIWGIEPRDSEIHWANNRAADNLAECFGGYDRKVTCK